MVFGLGLAPNGGVSLKLGLGTSVVAVLVATACSGRLVPMHLGGPSVDEDVAGSGGMSRGASAGAGGTSEGSTGGAPDHSNPTDPNGQPWGAGWPRFEDDGGAAGSAGSAGAEQSCDANFKILQAITGAADVVAWPELKRLAFTTRSGPLEVYDVSAVASGGALVELAEISNDTLGLSSEWVIQGPLMYGDGLVLSAINIDQTKIFAWHLQTGATELAIPLPSQTRLISAADSAVGLAFVAGGKIYRATESAGTWVVGEPIFTAGQQRVLLAFADDELLVGLQAPDRWYTQNTGTAGQIGAAVGWNAAVERWNSAGNLLGSYPSLGTPRVALSARGGWLIGETNSFWGSMNAALEWLNPAKDELRNLSKVPVLSSGDGEDGAFGAAVKGSTVFVANCESGLRSGPWQGDNATLSPLWNPPDASFSRCDPKAVHVFDDLLVIVGGQLTFARVCDQ